MTDGITKAVDGYIRQAMKDLGVKPTFPDYEGGDLTADHEEFCTGKVGWLTLGVIEWKVDSDRHDNKVSIITMPDGTKYRMVHHRSQSYYEYATIYAGRNKFMRFRYRETESDCAMNTIELGGYSMGWGDGDPMCFVNHPAGPDLKAIFATMREGRNERACFILNVLFHAGMIDACWDSK